MTKRGTTNSNSRGGSEERRRRKWWLLGEFGDGVSAPCAFACGTIVTFETITVDRYPVPGCRGGGYRRGNIRPACGPCNSRHGGSLRAEEGDVVESGRLRPGQPFPAEE